MSLTELMRFTRVEQDTLCCGRFTGVNMRHDPDIANPFERIFSWHRISSLLTFCVVNSFVFYLLTLNVECIECSRAFTPPHHMEQLRMKYPADIYIVAAFGQILSQEILDLPKYGCLNIHASLLPKYRGASPIQRVIIDGEAETGVTIMQMNAGLDTGDMLYRKKIPITSEDTFETLHDKLMVLGGEAITEALPLLEAGKLVPEKQDDTKTCYAALITKEMGKLDFTKTAAELDRLIRGLTPWPSAYTHYHGKQLKIWKAIPMATAHKEAPGTILTVNKDSFEVAASEGSLKVMELQLEGKKRMTTHDFLLGVKVQPGELLGER